MSVHTIDASVFGNAVFSDEVGHGDSRGLLDRVHAREMPVVVIHCSCRSCQLSLHAGLAEGIRRSGSWTGYTRYRTSRPCP